MSARFERKSVLVTGGSSGIGLATAALFASEEATVFITGRRQAELDKAVRELGKNVVGIQGDVTKSHGPPEGSMPSSPTPAPAS